MGSILPETDDALPLGSIPATASTTPAPAAKPISQKRKQRPKLSVADVTTASAIDAALSIGRRVAARGMPEPGHEGAALNALLGKMRRWAADVAPDYDIAEFVVAAQGLAGKRELRPVLGNLRLAELRQVTGGWEELQMRKRMARKGRKKIVEEEEDVEGREDGESGGKGETGLGEEEGKSGEGRDVGSLMLDPEVKERIERNMQIALQRRLKAAGGASVGAGKVSTGGRDDMDIDPNDIIEMGAYDEQDDIDMDVLDEMQDWDRGEVKAANGGENTEDKGTKVDTAVTEGGTPAESDKPGATLAEKDGAGKGASVESDEKTGAAVADSGDSDARKKCDPKRLVDIDSPRCSEAAVNSVQGGEPMSDVRKHATVATSTGSRASPTASLDRETEQATLPTVASEVETAATPKEVAGQEVVAEHKGDAGEKRVADQKTAAEQDSSDERKDVVRQKDTKAEEHEDIDMDILGEFEATNDEEY